MIYVLRKIRVSAILATARPKSHQHSFLTPCSTVPSHPCLSMSQPTCLTSTTLLYLRLSAYLAASLNIQLSVCLSVISFVCLTIAAYRTIYLPVNRSRILEVFTQSEWHRLNQLPSPTLFWLSRYVFVEICRY